jgi:conjugal transfer pilus assembly protein TraV
MNVFKIAAAVAVVAVVAVVAGCAASGRGEFSCAGMPRGVACLPASTVYEITSDPELERAFRAELAKRTAGRGKVDPAQVLEEVRATRVKSSGVETSALMQPVRQPLPVLEPARVVRIWIAPWIDQKGDLRMPGYVFSEITPRKWSFGEAQIDQTNVLVPIQVERDVAPPAPNGPRRAATPPAPSAAPAAVAVQRAAQASSAPPAQTTKASAPPTLAPVNATVPAGGGPR